MRKKAMKLVKKNYHLVNESTNERVTVFPTNFPGENADKKSPKNKDGEWIRRFDVKDTNGVKSFEGKATVVLQHKPKEAPYAVIDGVRWSLQVIEKEPVTAEATAEKKDESKSMLEKAQEDIRSKASVAGHADLKDQVEA